MAIGLKVKTFGAKKLARELDKLKKRAPSALAGSVYEEAQVIGIDARRRTPEKDGHLKASEFVTRPKPGDIVSFIGYTAPHARTIHGARRKGVKLNLKSGEERFLSKALRAARGGYLRRVGRRMFKMLRRRQGVSSVRARFPETPPSGTGGRS